MGIVIMMFAGPMTKMVPVACSAIKWGGPCAKTDLKKPVREWEMAFSHMAFWP